MTDDFARWAARRADDLIARAEAEVVAELKAVLLHAAESAVSGETPTPAVKSQGTSRGDDAISSTDRADQ